MGEKLEHLFTRDKRSRFFLRPDSIQFILCILIIGFYLVILSSGRMERIENIFLDYFFRQRPALAVNPSIAIIEIGDESIQAIGRWPWPWYYHARMIKLLKEWGAKAVVFDLIFKPETAAFENDELEKAISESGEVYLPVALEPKPQKKFWVHSLPIVLEPPQAKKIWIHSAPALEKYARAIGHINAESDADGVLRRISPYLVNENEMHPHLALQVTYDEMGKELSSLKDLGLPLDRDGSFLINWAGKWKDAFERFSYADLVRSYQSVGQGRSPAIHPEVVKGKICLIGLTAHDVASFKVTPLEAACPVVAVHANIVNSILNKRFAVPVSPLTNAICLAVIGLIVSMLFMNFRHITSFVIGLAVGVLWIVAAFVLFAVKGIWLYVFHPLLLILSLFIFSAIFSHLIASWERSRLFDLATRDGLTGLYVIRYFREILNRIINESKAKGTPLSLVLIDIDNFKKINDTYGHPAGDMVLKKVAKIISNCLRSKRRFQEMDFVARYGGEEFIIILRNTKIEDAVSKVAERIRSNIEQGLFEWESKNILVTVSLGVAVLHDDENVPDRMVRRADDALYQAKRTGKNRVCSEPSSTS